jgi:hypothetical protein
MRKLAVLFTAGFLLVPVMLHAQAAFGVRLSTTALLGTFGPVNQQGGYFGYMSGERATFLAGLDFSRIAIDNSSGTSVSSVVPFFGIKYCFRDIGDDVATPYVKLEFNKTITSANDVGDLLLMLVDVADTSLIDIGDEEAEAAEDALEDLLSPWGLTFAFGGEYFFSDEFSLGGEFGLRNKFHSSEIEIMEGVSEKVSLNYHDTYVALTANFIF